MAEAKALVLFDIDGTLIRGAGPHHKDALIEGIRKVTGVTTSLEGVATGGMLDRDLVGLMLRAGGHSEEDISAALPDIVSACHEAYLENCASDLRSFVCPGVAEFLETLKTKSAVLGVVSGNLIQIGRKKLELAGLLPYFSVTAFSEDGSTRTELAKKAAARARTMGLPDSDCRISLVGDHQNDIIAAKANGFRSVAVATGLSPIEELRLFSPDILVQDLSELDPEALL